MAVRRNIASRVFTAGAVFSNAFSPREVWGNTCWLRGDLGVVESGGAVSEWSDQSVVGTNDFVQATGGNKPAYDATSNCNGLPGLTFNGTASKMTSSGNSDQIISAANAFVFVALNLAGVTIDSATVYGNDSVFSDNGADYGAVVRNNAGTYQLRAYAYDGTYDEPTLHTVSLSTTYVLTWKHTGGSLSHTYNNTAANSTASGNTSGLGTSAMQLGSCQGIRYLNADVAEFVAFNVALSSTDERRVRFYMTKRYGV